MLLTLGRSLLFGGLVASLQVEATQLSSRPKPIVISKSAPLDAGVPLDSFVSFSFELSSWPDFAGTSEPHPTNITVRLIIVSYRKSIASKQVLV